MKRPWAQAGFSRREICCSMCSASQQWSLWNEREGEMTSFLIICRTGIGSFLCVCQRGYLALLDFRLRQPDRIHLAEMSEGWTIWSCKNKDVYHTSGRAFAFILHTRDKDAFFQSNRMDADRMRQAEGYGLLGHRVNGCARLHTVNPLFCCVSSQPVWPQLPTLIILHHHKVSSPSLKSRMSNFIQLFTLYSPWFNFERLRRGGIWFDFVQNVETPEKDPE